MKTCCYCGKPDAEAETRPYGPGGADICRPCATSTPEREAQMQARLRATVDHLLNVGGVFDERGIHPSVPMPVPSAGEA